MASERKQVRSSHNVLFHHVAQSPPAKAGYGKFKHLIPAKITREHPNLAQQILTHLQEPIPEHYKHEHKDNTQPALLSSVFMKPPHLKHPKK